jgi:hypothetical protein
MWKLRHGKINVIGTNTEDIFERCVSGTQRRAEWVGAILSTVAAFGALDKILPCISKMALMLSDSRAS